MEEVQGENLAPGRFLSTGFDGTRQQIKMDVYVSGTEDGGVSGFVSIALLGGITEKAACVAGFSNREDGPKGGKDQEKQSPA